MKKLCFFMTKRLFPTSKSKVQEDKRRWSLSPVGKRPSVIRRARFYLVLYSHQNLSCLKSGVDISGFIGNDTVEEQLTPLLRQFITFGVNAV